MDQLIYSLIGDLPTLVLVLIIASMLYVLGKSADVLVDQAVILSLRWGVPKIIIGATIISLGTTLPEASVSIMAAIAGQPGLALGNGIGSVIANTGLILGLAIIIGQIPIERNLVRRQGTIMIACSIAIVIASIPFLSGTDGGNISRLTGLVFVVLLAVYMISSVRRAKMQTVEITSSQISKEAVASVDKDLALQEEAEDFDLDQKSTDSPIYVTLIKMAISIAVIIVSSKILIQSVEIGAVRIGIPQSIIAATLIAFGTSLPELILALKSVSKGHGELALGNVVGANILNILFVIGTSAVVTSGGLAVPKEYYNLQYPALLIVMALFAVAAYRKKDHISRKYGVWLLAAYVIYIVMNYV